MRAAIYILIVLAFTVIFMWQLLVGISEQQRINEERYDNFRADTKLK